MRMRALYASNYFTAGPPARRFDNPYFIPSTQVLLQQLVNKGKAVTPPAVATWFTETTVLEGLVLFQVSATV